MLREPFCVVYFWLFANHSHQAIGQVVELFGQIALHIAVKYITHQWDLLHLPNAMHLNTAHYSKAKDPPFPLSPSHPYPASQRVL